jgi:hypothetical protein
VTSRGADPTGAADSTAAFNSAISAAGAGGTVWIPEGTYKIPGHVIVNNVTIKGAGIWRSTVVGAAPGFYGNFAPNPSSGVHLADFAIFGDVQERNDGAQVNGIGGALTNSTVDRVWIEHMKVGAWMDGPFTNLVMSGLRIRNVTADGVNFHNGITNSKVTNSDLRNLGDDGLATWSEQNADANDSFDHNTVQYPILANGIAIYGGHDNFVTDNRVIDSGLTQGGGIHVAQRFASTTLGRTDVLRNTIIRSGSLDPNWQFGVGALWFDARDAAMSGLTNVDNILIQQSPFEAIHFVSGSSITNVHINNATIQNTGTWVVQEQVGGSATITNSTATGTQAPGPIYNCGVGFTLTDGGGNSGIFGATQCQNITAPAFPPYLPDNGFHHLRQPDLARIRFAGHGFHQRGPGRHRDQHRHRRGAGHVDHYLGRLRPDQQLRQQRRRGVVLHSQRHVQPHGGGRPERKPHSDHRRNYQHRSFVGYRCRPRPDPERQPFVAQLPRHDRREQLGDTNRVSDQ